MAHGFRFLSLLALSVLASACNREAASTPPTEVAAAGTLPDHDPDLAHRLVAGGALLLDVRTRAEYAERHIEGAANVPVDEVENDAGAVDLLTHGEKQRPIVVYCAAGARAARAKQALVKRGYRQVSNLGGIDDWDRD